jgi:hypothetical protein
VVRTRCKIAPLVEDSLAQRAVNFYSALEATFAAPSFSAPVGDVLKLELQSFIVAPLSMSLELLILKHIT